MINIIRSYLLPIIEVFKNKKFYMNEYKDKATYLRYCLDNNICFDEDGTTIFNDLKNSKIKYIKLGKQSYWSIRKL